MTEPKAPGSPEWLDASGSWTCRHFAISDDEANVSRLLRKVADAIDSLGKIDILDVTFCLEVEGPAFEAKMAVYYDLPVPAD